jgi:uncharacterized protein (TIGR04255 family)
MINMPFGDDVVHEVHLSRAPLEYVVSQIRFPLVAELRDEQSARGVFELLKTHYPVFHRDQAMEIAITSEGMITQQGQDVVWRFEDKPGDWQVGLSSGFVALSTSNYDSRDDFCGRLLQVLSACVEAFDPPIAERVGVRYIDRIKEPEQFDRLPELVRGELLGGHAIPTGGSADLIHSFAEAAYERGDHELLARWGVLPSNAVHDPQVKPTTNKSWILDLDVTASGRFEFDAHALSEQVRGFSSQVYRFFRWAVTNEILRESGGEL